MKKTFTILAATLFMVACSSSKQTTIMGPDLYQKWDVKVLNGNDISGVFSRPVYIEFNQEESRVSGSAACNRFFGSYTRSGNTIEFKPLASTKMFCDEVSNKFESEFLSSLQTVNNFKFDGNSLILLNNSEVIARLEESNAVPDELAGNWELFYITGRRIAFEGLYPEKKPFIRFQQGNADFSANTSCNSLMGSYKGGKKGELFDLGAMTLMACPGEGEQVFVDELKKVDAYLVSGDTLTFLSKDIPTMKFSKSNIITTQ